MVRMFGSSWSEAPGAGVRPGVKALPFFLPDGRAPERIPNPT